MRRGEIMLRKRIPSAHQLGFTLLEIAVVILCIGVLASVLSPNLHRIFFRMQTAEPRTTLPAIAHAELAYRRDHGAFIACAPSSAEISRGREGSFDATRPGWKEIGFAAEGRVTYQYEVTLRGATFDVHARGDLNGDGVPSHFVLAGDTMKLTIEKELE